MLFLAMPLSCLYVYAPELYPTPVRAIGAGAASAWIRIGSIIGPICVGYILPAWGIKFVFLFFTLACVGGFVIVAMKGVETKGRILQNEDVH